MQKDSGSEVLIISAILFIIIDNFTEKSATEMDNREKLYLMLEWWFGSGIPSYINRDIVNINHLQGLNVALGIAGVRRSGKTYTLFELADKLRKKYPKKSVIYINFEDQRLHPLNGKEIFDLFDVLKEKYNPPFPFFLLLDEIQVLPQWERNLRTVIDNRMAKVISTGSSSILTGEELPSVLGGRTLTMIIYPLSFKEFLQFKGVKIEPMYLKYTGHPELLRLLEEYLNFGGFPEVVLSENKMDILNELFLTIFYRDLVSRYKIYRTPEFEAFIHLLVRNSASLFSVSKTWNTLKSLGFKISKGTLFKYLEYARSVFLVYPVEIFSYGIKDRLQYPKKIYVVDNGFLSLTMFKVKRDEGALLENAVFIELKRRRIYDNIFYWKNKRGEEVDFVLLRNITPYKLIQVCVDLSDEKTLKREIRALKKASEELRVKDCYIITKDTSGEEKIGKLKIRILSFWEWALDFTKEDL